MGLVQDVRVVVGVMAVVRGDGSWGLVVGKRGGGGVVCGGQGGYLEDDGRIEWNGDLW